MAEAGQGRGKPKKAGTKKERGPNEAGPVRLQRAAARAVGRNSGKLTQMLLDKALAGHVESTKLLVTLAEPKKTDEKAKKKRRGPSMAERLAQEPSWDDHSPEEQKRILIQRGEWSSEDDFPMEEFPAPGGGGDGNL
jgi:hypothetical protein